MKVQIIKLREKGYSYNKIAKELNVSKAVISYHLKNIGMNNPLGDKGLELKKEVIEEIIELHKNGITKKKIAKKLNISYTTVIKYTGKNITEILTDDEKKNKLYEKHKNWRVGIKIKAIKYLGGECIKCGYKKCVAALDLHHKGDEKKEFVISGSNLKAFDKLIPELNKCVVLCSNCHREHHYPHLIDIL